MKVIFLIISFFLSFIINVQAGVLGKRYCEIVYSKNFMDFYVYRSSTESACPQSWWSKLKASILQKKYNARFVHLNGPRLWMVDDIQYHQHGKLETQNIEGQKLNLVGSFHPNLKMLFEHHGPYVEYQIHRAQSYTFNKGRYLLELVSPNGQVYVLQSLSLKYRKQSVDDITKLQEVLKLPKGWTIKQGTLSKNQMVSHPSQVMHIVQDELENTYQLAEKDLL